MLNTLIKTAWATTLAVGGLLVIGAAAARADDARRGDYDRGDRTARPEARRGHDGRDHHSFRARESGRDRDDTHTRLPVQRDERACLEHMAND